jgi:hypothetical protein
MKYNGDCFELHDALHSNFLCCLVFSSATALARLGETADQFAARYGAPNDTAASKILDKNLPLLDGAIHHTYEYEGWRIRAAFLEPNGPAVRMVTPRL